MSNYILAGNFEENFVKILPKMLLVETLDKLVQIFPPKVLVYTRKISHHIFNKWD